MAVALVTGSDRRGATIKVMATKKPAVCEHDWVKDRSPYGGADTGDVVCRKCGAIEWGGNVRKREDAVQAARRVVDEATGQRPKTVRPPKAAPKKK